MFFLDLVKLTWFTFFIFFEKEFDLSDRGSIEIGKTADLLVLQVTTIEHYFQTLGRPLIHRMIKNGIQFYPEWMVC